MGAIARGARNLFRNGVWTGVLVALLPLGMGLPAAMVQAAPRQYPGADLAGRAPVARDRFW